jgi:arabinan endo-1,5-alpha-L-arabinosidase
MNVKDRSSLSAILPLAILLVAMRAVGQTTPPAATPGAQVRPQGPAVGVPVVGMPFVHDPSTVVRFHGRYYVFATGRGIPFSSSPDGITWTREGSVFTQIPDDVHATVPKNNGADVWAPDIIRIGDLFYMYYAVSSWGSFNSSVALITNPVLDPKDPAYKWTDRGVVVSSDGVEDLNAIDPGVILAPDGTLWLCYGSYHGTIDLVQLDPKTGLRISPKSPITIIASRAEASDIIFHDGFYYLFVDHDSCCKGKDSQYNIRVGRSREITGPYLDRHEQAMTKGAGSLFLAAHDHRIGPGHFGRLLDYDEAADGAERFSIHYEGEMTRGGRSTLDIRPLLWSGDGWPVAGDNLAEGVYQIVSRQSENNLGVYAPPPPRAAPGAAPPAAGAPPAAPSGPPAVHMGHYLTLDNEKWTIAPAEGGFYKIVNVGSGTAMQVSGDATAVGLAAYTDADSQLWRLEQFPDGGYRILNKANGLSLSEGAAGTVAAGPFVADDLHRWTITTP